MAGCHQLDQLLAELGLAEVPGQRCDPGAELARDVRQPVGAARGEH
jgi:hypothetical protein